MDKIETEVELLKREIFKKQDLLWNTPPQSYIEFCDPHIATKVLGYQITYEDTLGSFGDGNRRFEVAGCLDKEKKLISISRKFNITTQRFTAAHEIGHICLHPDIHMHRDRPIDGLKGVATSVRKTKEEEADKFSAIFLVSKKLLREELHRRFGSTSIAINDDWAFKLCPSDPQSLTLCDGKFLERELAVAKYTGMRKFYSLAEAFGVSVTTMAIRLQETELVKNWP